MVKWGKSPPFSWELTFTRSCFATIIHYATFQKRVNTIIALLQQLWRIVQTDLKSNGINLTKEVQKIKCIIAGVRAGLAPESSNSGNGHHRKVESGESTLNEKPSNTAFF